MELDEDNLDLDFDPNAPEMMIHEDEVAAMATVLGHLSQADGVIADEEIDRAAFCMSIFAGAYSDVAIDPENVIPKDISQEQLQKSLETLKQVDLVILLDFLSHAVGVVLADGFVDNEELNDLHDIFRALAPKGKEEAMEHLVQARVEAMRLECELLAADEVEHTAA